MTPDIRLQSVNQFRVFTDGWRSRFCGLLFGLFAVFASYTACAADADANAELVESSIVGESTIAAEPELMQDQAAGNIDSELQELKKEVLALNRDLFILKEELMFPAHTQIAVFLSLDVGEFFALDSVSLKLNDQPVASHLYTPKQNNALVRGGVQRLYLGNVKHGTHELVAVFTGRGPQGRDYRRATSLEFEKGDEATHLEVKITDSEKLLQPEFAIKAWD
ncbi:MAG: AraC family transcriptional regulator [Pseudomonadales bacterium]